MTTLPQTSAPVTGSDTLPFWRQPATVLQVLLFAIPLCLTIAWYLITLGFTQQAQAKVQTETSTSMQRIQDARENTASRLAVLEQSVSDARREIQVMGQDIKELLKAGKGK